MQERYELIYGYRHCTKETVFSAGFVDTEEEAAEWALLKSGEQGSADPPKSDPLCNCEVSFCPMKFQRPWYSYRKISL
jgi:hypothetical protein